MIYVLIEVRIYLLIGKKCIPVSFGPMRKILYACGLQTVEIELVLIIRHSGCEGVGYADER